jgi:hypothetical protein
MLDTTCLAVSALLAHTQINPETQRELQLSIARALNNAPTGVTLHQKQLALIIVHRGTHQILPPGNQVDNSLAVIATLILGPRLLTAVSRTDSVDVDPEGLH